MATTSGSTFWVHTETCTRSLRLSIGTTNRIGFIGVSSVLRKGMPYFSGEMRI